MKRNHKSIGARIKHGKNPKRRQEILIEWADGWKKDQLFEISELRKAIEKNNYSEAEYKIDHLIAITEKRFTGLCNVLMVLTDMLIDGNGSTDSCEDEEKSDVQVNENYKLDTSITNDNTVMESQEFTLDRKPSVDILKMKDLDIEEIVKSYQSGMSTEEIAKWNNISYRKVIKILVTVGIYSSDTYDKVKEMREEGKSNWEIMDRLDINAKTLNDYTPYKKGIYNLTNDASKNAERVRAFRKRKKDLDI